MRVGIFGTGMVGQTLAGKVAGLGHDVMVGTRDVQAAVARTEGPRPGMPSFAEWSRSNPGVKVGTFADAAAHGEILFNATAGAASLDALEAAGAGNLNGKILVDVSNPLDFSKGMPPTLTVSNTDSLGEQIQRAYPEAKVVKTLNTVTAKVMVEPRDVGEGDHHVFAGGNDDAAKDEVTGVLQGWFGWANVVDLGDITSARATEMYLILWVRIMATAGPMFNIKVVR